MTGTAAADVATDIAAKEILAAYRLHARSRDATRDLPAIASIMVMRWSAWSHGAARGRWQAVKRVLPDPGTLAATLDDVLRNQAPELAAVTRFDPDMAWMAAVIDAVDRHCPERFADVFEALLVDLVRGGELRTGDFHTPRTVADLIVGLVQPGSGATVHDPACSSGGILAAAVRRTDGLKAVVGRALNSTAMALSSSALFLHGHVPDILLADATTSHPGFDFVLSNPPFAPADPAHEGSFAWVQKALDSLAAEGRAVIVLPAAAAGSGRDSAQRGELLQKDLVEAVIALPPQLFPGTDVAPHIWVLTKNRKRPPCRQQVLLVDASRVGVRRGRGERELTEQETADIVSSLMRWRISGKVDAHRPGDRVQSRAMALAELMTSGCVVTPGRHVTRGPALSTLPRAQVLLRQYTELQEAASRLDPLITEAASVWENQHRQGPRQDDPFGGKVPSSWRIVPLAKLLSEATDRTGKPILTGPSGQKIPGGLHTDTGVPVVMPKDIGDNTLSAERAFRVAEHTADGLDRFRLCAGDIVLARRGEMGRRALVRPEHEGWLFGTGCIRIRCGDVVDPGYLAAYLGRPNVRDWLTAHAQGTTALLSITSAALGELQIVLPPREVQVAVRNADELLGRRLAMAAEAADVLAKLRPALLAEIMGS